jgi:hypothetical protein
VVFMVGVAAEDVDEALADALHSIRPCTRRAIGPCYFAERIEWRDRDYAVSACGGSRRVQIPAVVRLRAFARSASYGDASARSPVVTGISGPSFGETAFACPSVRVRLGGGN